MDTEESSGSTNTDINNNLREILSELRKQQFEINSLKNNINSPVPVKLDTKKEIKWKFEGNRRQYEFNSEIEDFVKQSLWAVENQKFDYAQEVLKEAVDKIHVRNKHIRIADTSEGGWETVTQYEINPLASDSDDESRINRAESRAVKKRKAHQSKAKKTRPAVLYGHSDAMRHLMEGQVGARPGPYPVPQKQTTGYSSFRGYSGFGSQSGPCFACGEVGHFRRTCPNTRGQQTDAQPRK